MNNKIYVAVSIIICDMRRDLWNRIDYELYYDKYKSVFRFSIEGGPTIFPFFNFRWHTDYPIV